MSAYDSESDGNRPAWEHLDPAVGGVTQYATAPVLPGGWSEPRVLPFGLPPIPQVPERPRGIPRWLWQNPWTPALLAATSAILLALGYLLFFLMAIGNLQEPNGSVSMFFAGALVLAVIGAAISAVVALLWFGYFVVRGRWYALVMLPALALPLIPLLPLLLLERK